MILVTVTVQGESDTIPHVTTFQYSESDEVVFFESVKMIKERISKGLRININETITFFVAHIVTELRNGRTADDIKQDIPRLLAQEKVLIGVPESLREVTFTVAVDGYSEKITVRTPIPVTDYIMGAL